MMKTSSMDTEYSSCHHSIIDLIKLGNSHTMSTQRKIESNMGNKFEIVDSTQANSYLFDIAEYNNIMDDYSLSPLYTASVSLFVNYSGTPEERSAIDVIFHYLHDGESMTISEKMKDSIDKLAKRVIGDELNHNLKDIVPVYDIEKMSPSWKVESLLSAMYLSLFYLKPDTQLYRQCENPNYNNYFMVKTTSTRTKYCCTRCANSVTQSRYRRKQK